MDSGLVVDAKLVSLQRMPQVVFQFQAFADRIVQFGCIEVVVLRRTLALYMAASAQRSKVSGSSPCFG